MAEKRFSELTTAGAMTGAELLAMSQETLGTLLSVKSTLQNIANWFAVNSQYASALDTTDKTLCGAINELKQLISMIPQFSIEVVQTLPTEDISETTIYLVPNSDPEQGNYYEEYIYVNNTWELVGTTAVDLSAYYTKLEVDGLLAAKANTSDVTAALALKEAKADLDDDVTDIVVGLTDEQTTAPGNPVTLTTEQSGGAKSALVTFAPKQDLHGQSAPYPAGGGKNKYSVLVGNDDWIGYNGGTSSGTDGVLSITSTSTNNSGVYASNTNKLYIYAGSNTGVYTLSAYVKASANATFRMGFSGLSSQDFSITTVWQRISITVTLDGSAHSIIFYSRGDAVTYNIKDVQLETGETATPYAPYSNICPISGRDSLSLGISGSKNHFKTTATSTVKNGVTYTVNTDGTIDVSGTPSGSASYMIGTADIRGLRGNIAVSAFAYSSQMCWDSVKVLDSNDTALYEYTTRDDSTVVIDLSQYPTADHLTITVRRYSTNPVSGTLKPQVEIGTTRTAFVPYTTPSIYTATFPSTVIGGSYDFVSGEGKKKYAKVKISDLTITKSQTGVYNAFIDDMKNLTTGNDIKCDGMRYGGTSRDWLLDKTYAIAPWQTTSTNRIAFVGDGTESTVEDLLANIGNYELSYEVSTPTPITLTPADVNLLKGLNMVWTDGDTVQVKYSELPQGNLGAVIDYIKQLEARIAALES